MGTKMQKLGKLVKADRELEDALIRTLVSGSTLPGSSLSELGDPDNNPLILNKLQSVIDQNTPDEESEEQDRIYMERISAKFRNACKQAGIALNEDQK